MPTTICVLSGLVAGSYPGFIIPAVAQAVSEAGGRVMAMQTVATGIDYHEEVTLQDLAHVGWRRIAGFITIANAVPRDYLEAIRAAGKPVVCVGNEEPGFVCPAVLADNAGGTRQAVEHLLAHGHRRIAFIGHLGEFDIRQRYEAYRGPCWTTACNPTLICCSRPITAWRTGVAPPAGRYWRPGCRPPRSSPPPT